MEKPTTTYMKGLRLRATVREQMRIGTSISRIAKNTGKSYTHIKNIVEQERHNIETGDTHGN